VFDAMIVYDYSVILIRQAEDNMAVLILVSVIVILLVSWAIASRINWFNQLEWEKKYPDSNSNWFKKYYNGGSVPYNANAKIKRAQGALSVINDGYGINDAPYEIWEQSSQPNEDYEDVEGCLSEEDVAKKVRKWF